MSESHRPRLPARRVPQLPLPSRKIDPFETRLALSANLGANALLNAMEALHNGDMLGACAPHPAAAISPESFEPATLSQPSTSPSGQTLPSLIDQAAMLREQFQLTGAGQTVAVIDSGIAWDHVALGEGFGPGYRVVGGWDFAENDANPYDDGPAGFHGTHVAGLVGGASDSFSGIAPGADLVGLRVFDDLGRGSVDWIESALQWVYNHRDAFEHPITTVNLSIGALLPETLASDIRGQLEDDLLRLHQANIVVVAAAGNQFNPAFPDRINYPASSDYAWPIASTDSSNSLSSFTQRESAILATDGRNVLSTVPDHVLGMDGEVNDYHQTTGTSMAAPQVAGATVLLRQAIEQVGGDSSPANLLHILQSTSIERLDPITGYIYRDVDLTAAVASILGSGASGEGPDSHAPGALVDLGKVDWKAIDLTPGSALQVTTVRDGLFSVFVDESQRDERLTIRDAQGQLLWNQPPPSSGQIDLPVTANQTLQIWSADHDTGTKIQLANILRLQNGELSLAGTDAHAPVTIDLRQAFAAQVGDFRYSFPAAQVTSGIIDGGQGADQLHLIGSQSASRLILNPYADGTLSDTNLNLILRSFEEVRFAGGGGGDRVFLYDTVGNDELVASPGSAVLRGVGFRYEATEIERVYVHATAGGQDVAFLHDSVNNDLLAVRPQFVSLRGGDFFNAAYGFERVYAFAGQGGFDSASLYDSTGDDRLTLNSTTSIISGPGFYAQARHFHSVTGYATSGGNDLATIYDDAANDSRWIRTADATTLLTSQGQERIARGFEQTEAYRNGTPLPALGSLFQQLQVRERQVLDAIFASVD